MEREKWLVQQGFSFFVSCDPQMGRVFFVAYYNGEPFEVIEGDCLDNMKELYLECENFLKVHDQQKV